MQENVSKNGCRLPYGVIYSHGPPKAKQSLSLFDSSSYDCHPGQDLVPLGLDCASVDRFQIDVGRGRYEEARFGNGRDGRARNGIAHNNPGVHTHYNNTAYVLPESHGRYPYRLR